MFKKKCFIAEDAEDYAEDAKAAVGWVEGSETHRFASD
jgi:hypothetical protein